jgi:hypothetical protein
MNRVAASILLAGVSVVACKKHEDAVRTDNATTATTATTTEPAASVVASPAPSETASAAASSSANPDPHIARQAALEQAREMGMIGLLNAGKADPNAPTAPWGREDSLGNDPMSARGNMWGNAIGDSFGDGGLGGLGLRGSGSGGGGQGDSIGLGNIGTIGHGAGTGTGQGFGSGSGRLGGPHTLHQPKIRQGQTTVNGRLPPEVIQRIVRQNFGRFRLCYENGLRSDPKLAGTVATKFVIDGQGAVSSSSRDASTTMTDAGVVSCINRAFSNLSFPQPEGGIVVVIYPVILDPGD